MKKIFLSSILITLTLVSCKDKESTTPSHKMDNNTTMMTKDSTVMDNSQMMVNKVYACPMHPEVQGKLNDKCSKCGMKLTEPVPEKTE